MIDSTNYGNQIVENLEQKGYTKDMIIGFLEGTLNGMKYLEDKKVLAYLQRTVEETKQSS